MIMISYMSDSDIFIKKIRILYVCLRFIYHIKVTYNSYPRNIGCSEICRFS